MFYSITLKTVSAACVIYGLTLALANAQSIVSEVRLGGAQLDATIERSNDKFNYMRDAINAELLFRRVNIDVLDVIGETKSDFLNRIINPRLHLGTTIALESDATSSAYAGLTWHFPVVSRLFVEGSFGAAIHNGELEIKDISGGKQRRGLGSSVLFRESISLGAKLTENVNLVLQLTHVSHAGFAGDDNFGQTDVALKLGWQF